jgi:hypothetical protein
VTRRVEMSGSKKEKAVAEEAPLAVRELEGLVSAMEQKVEALAARARDLTAENARLKAAIVETVAERDRLKKELEDSLETGSMGVEAAEKLAWYEAEREVVKTRIERLIRNLEEAEGEGSRAGT